jgi:UDP-N-acetyl-2-amino-2-deoxyglucuronate dehydrogenase
MTHDLGVGIVGFGHIAPKHVDAIQQTDGLAIRGVCDIVAERAQRAGAALHVPWFDDYERLLEQPEVDIIALCTPNHLHVPMARRALAAGKHAVVEKPLAFSAQEALELGDAFDRAGLGLFCVLQVRFNPTVRAVHTLIQSDGLGRIYLGSLAQRWNRRDDYFEGPAAWHGVKALEGGSLYTQGVHYIDLLLHLIGPIEEVSAHADTLAHDIETEDAAVATLRYACGAMGVLEFSLDAYDRNLEASITLLGEKGNIVLGGTAANELTLWNVASQRPPEGLETVVPNDYGGRYSGSPPNHADIYRNVVVHLADRTEPIAVTAASAAASLRVIEAIYTSATTARPVRISYTNAEVGDG